MNKLDFDNLMITEAILCLKNSRWKNLKLIFKKMSKTNNNIPKLYNLIPLGPVMSYHNEFKNYILINHSITPLIWRHLKKIDQDKHKENFLVKYLIDNVFC